MSRNNRLILVLMTIMFGWLLLLSFNRNSGGPASSEEVINEYSVSGFSTDFTEVVDKCQNSIVSVSAENSIQSGFVYSQNGDSVYVVTAYHGLSEASSISVTFGSSYAVNATMVGYDIYADLAVLEIETPYAIEALKIGDSGMLRAGEFLIAIGTPVSLDYAGSVELCMVSENDLTIENSITIDEERYNYYLDVVEISSNLRSGYSGSPLLNMAGEVVGMNTMSLNSTLSFALTANEMNILADAMIAGRERDKVQFGFKGRYIKDMPAYEKSNLDLHIETISGIYVQRVKENSLAFNVGIRAGDVISRINSQDIRDINDYLSMCYAPADTYTFEIIRNGETMVLASGND